MKHKSKHLKEQRKKSLITLEKSREYWQELQKVYKGLDYGKVASGRSVKEHVIIGHYIMRTNFILEITREIRMN